MKFKYWQKSLTQGEDDSGEPTRPRRHNSRKNDPSTMSGGRLAPRQKKGMRFATVTLLAGSLVVAILLTIRLSPGMPRRDGISLQQVLDAAPQLWPDAAGHAFGSIIFFAPPPTGEQQRLRLTLHLMGDEAVPILLKKVCAQDSPLTRWVIRPVSGRFRSLRRFLPDQDQWLAWLALEDLVMPLHTRRPARGELPVMCTLSDSSRREIVEAVFSLLREHPGKYFLPGDHGYIRRLSAYAILKELPEQVEQDSQLMDELKKWANNISLDWQDRYGALSVLKAIEDPELRVLPAWLIGDE